MKVYVCECVWVCGCVGVDECMHECVCIQKPYVQPHFFRSFSLPVLIRTGVRMTQESARSGVTSRIATHALETKL